MNDETIPISAGGEPGSPVPRLRDSSVAAKTDSGSIPEPFTGPKGRNLSGITLGGCQLVRKIAEGGMGEVYEAIQTKLGRKVALKVLTERLADRPEFLARFEREARAAAALNHPNVVQVYDFGEDAGHRYLIMEFIEGEDLTNRIIRQGKLTPAEGLDVVEQAAQALKFASRKSIIHRDIKPANLLINADGRIKVSDLGLAKILTESTEVTATNVAIGSPHFLAPEQADDAKTVDHRADIYSLGITLLYLLTGKKPFDGSSAFSVVMAHANRPLPTGRDLGTELPDAIESLIRRMTAKDPDERYQDYEALLADIELVKAGFAPEMPLSTRRFRRFVSQQAPLLAAVVALIAVGGLMVALWPKKPEHKPEYKSVKAAAQPVVATVTPAAPATPPGNTEPRNGRPLPPMAGGPGDATRFGPPTLKLPLPQPPQPDRTPLKDAPVDQMLAEANSFAKTNANRPVKVLDRYFQVQRKATGTKWATEAESKVTEWKLTHQIMVSDAIEKCLQKMQAPLDSLEPQQALEVWKDFPPELITPEVVTLIRKTLSDYFPPEVRINIQSIP